MQIMFQRLMALLGIVLALFGLLVVPGWITRASRRRVLGIVSLHPDRGDEPWDLADSMPVGWVDRRGPQIRREWSWWPAFRKVDER